MKLADNQLNLDHPVWVDDEKFQRERHLQHVGVPSPGGRRELAEICGYIAGLPLDRDRPLWETWVLQGGANSDAVVVMLKVHHALIDGVAGANLLGHLCSLRPDAPAPEAVRGAGGGNPVQIALSGLMGFARRPLRLATVVPATLLTLARTALRAREGRTMAGALLGPAVPVQRLRHPLPQHRLHPVGHARRQACQGPLRRDRQRRGGGVVRRGVATISAEARPTAA